MNKLFSKVEATKPPASRNVSAEIFVVCLGYLAPKRLDPKLLSAKHVFKDLDLVAPADGAEASTSKAPGQSLNIFGPEKKRRRREGYADGDMTLFRSVPIREFIESTDPIGVLSNCNKLEFGADDKPYAELYPLSADAAVCSPTSTRRPRSARAAPTSRCSASRTSRRCSNGGLRSARRCVCGHLSTLIAAAWPRAGGRGAGDGRDG